MAKWIRIQLNYCSNLLKYIILQCKFGRAYYVFFWKHVLEDKEILNMFKTCVLTGNKAMLYRI